MRFFTLFLRFVCHSLLLLLLPLQPCTRTNNENDDDDLSCSVCPCLQAINFIISCFIVFHSRYGCTSVVVALSLSSPSSPPSIFPTVKYATNVDIFQNTLMEQFCFFVFFFFKYAMRVDAAKTCRHARSSLATHTLMLSRCHSSLVAAAAVAAAVHRRHVLNQNLDWFN